MATTTRTSVLLRPVADPLGVRRGVTGLRAELRDALLESAAHHDCYESVDLVCDDCAMREDSVYVGRAIPVDDSYLLTELLDTLEAIVRRGGAPC